MIHPSSRCRLTSSTTAQETSEFSPSYHTVSHVRITSVQILVSAHVSHVFPIAAKNLNTGQTETRYTTNQKQFSYVLSVSAFASPPTAPPFRNFYFPARNRNQCPRLRPKRARIHLQSLVEQFSVACRRSLILQVPRERSCAGTVTHSVHCLISLWRHARVSYGL